MRTSNRRLPRVLLFAAVSLAVQQAGIPLVPLAPAERGVLTLLSLGLHAVLLLAALPWVLTRYRLDPSGLTVAGPGRSRHLAWSRVTRARRTAQRLTLWLEDGGRFTLWTWGLDREFLARLEGYLATPLSDQTLPVRFLLNGGLASCAVEARGLELICPGLFRQTLESYSLLESSARLGRAAEVLWMLDPHRQALAATLPGWAQVGLSLASEAGEPALEHRGSRLRVLLPWSDVRRVCWRSGVTGDLITVVVMDRFWLSFQVLPGDAWALRRQLERYARVTGYHTRRDREALQGQRRLMLGSAVLAAALALFTMAGCWWSLEPACLGLERVASGWSYPLFFLAVLWIGTAASVAADLPGLSRPLRTS